MYTVHNFPSYNTRCDYEIMPYQYNTFFSFFSEHTQSKTLVDVTDDEYGKR